MFHKKGLILKKIFVIFNEIQWKNHQKYTRKVMLKVVGSLKNSNIISTYAGVVMAQFGVPWLMNSFEMNISDVMKVLGLVSVPWLFFPYCFKRKNGYTALQ